VIEATDEIIAAGIAHRVLTQSGQNHLPRTPEGCRFWVEKSVIGNTGIERTSVVVQYPPHDHQQSFRAERGKPFGTSDCPPLSEEQISLVERLAAQDTAT
jgi:hypothetical protein